MDENNNNYEHNHHNDEHCFLCGHPTAKHILIGLLVFLGAFSAFYVVTDWHFKRMLDPMVQVKKIDKMMQKEDFYTRKMMRKEFRDNTKVESKVNQIVHIEKLDDIYKIIIDLKPFDNNEKNVVITTEGDTLTINAVGEKAKYGRENIIRLAQSYTFPEDVDLTKITKMREADQYIIRVPID